MRKTFDTSQHLNDVKMRNLLKLQKSFTPDKVIKKAPYLIQRKLANARLVEDQTDATTPDFKGTNPLQPLYPGSAGGNLTYWENPNFKYTKR